MKSRWIFIPVAGIIFLAAGFFFLFTNYGSGFISGSNASPGDPLPPDVLTRIQSGDIIMRRGTSFVSSMIVEILGDPPGFSHCGILVPAENEGWQVIHSVSRSLSDLDGVQIEALESFVRNSIPGSTTLVRLRSSFAPTDQSLADRARTILAQGYGFDNLFRLGVENGVYCSELLWLILPSQVLAESLKFQEPGHIIRFESFLDDRFYEVIYDAR